MVRYFFTSQRTLLLVVIMIYISLIIKSLRLHWTLLYFRRLIIEWISRWSLWLNHWLSHHLSLFFDFTLKFFIFTWWINQLLRRNWRFREVILNLLDWLSGQWSWFHQLNIWRRVRATLLLDLDEHLTGIRNADYTRNFHWDILKGLEVIFFTLFKWREFFFWFVCKGQSLLTLWTIRLNHYKFIWIPFLGWSAIKAVGILNKFLTSLSIQKFGSSPWTFIF
jgi:hypothetical protein